MTKKWSNTFLVGVYKCHMTYTQGGGLHAEWSPDVPQTASLTAQQRNQYRAGRDALLAEVGKELGGAVMVIET